MSTTNNSYLIWPSSDKLGQYIVLIGNQKYTLDYYGAHGWRHNGLNFNLLKNKFVSNAPYTFNTPNGQYILNERETHYSHPVIDTDPIGKDEMIFPVRRTNLNVPLALIYNTKTKKWGTYNGSYSDGAKKYTRPDLYSLNEANSLVQTLNKAKYTPKYELTDRYYGWGTGWFANYPPLLDTGELYPELAQSSNIQYELGVDELDELEDFSDSESTYVPEVATEKLNFAEPAVKSPVVPKYDINLNAPTTIQTPKISTPTLQSTTSINAPTTPLASAPQTTPLVDTSQTTTYPAQKFDYNNFNELLNTYGIPKIANNAAKQLAKPTVNKPTVNKPASNANKPEPLAINTNKPETLDINKPSKYPASTLSSTEFHERFQSIGPQQSNSTGLDSKALADEFTPLLSENLGVNWAKASTVAGYVTQGVNLVDGIIGSQSEKVQDLSDLTKGLNSAYDVAMSAVGAIPVWGLVAQAGMAAMKLANTGMRALGIGTDLITTADKILDSNWFGLSPLGLANKVFASKTSKMYGDVGELKHVASSYAGQAKDINEAHAKAGKKVGAVSTIFGETDKINDQIEKASSDLQKISSIVEENQYALAGQSNQFLGLRNLARYNGGMQGRLRAKHGSKLYDRDTYQKVLAVKKAKKFGKGGDLSASRTLDELIAYAKQKNPRFIQRMSEPVRFVTWKVDDPYGYTSEYSGTHEMSYMDGKVFPMILEIDGKLVRFTDPDVAYKTAIDNNNYLEMNNEEAELFSKSNNNTEGYKSGWPEFFTDLPEEFWTFWTTLPENLQNNNDYRMYDYWRFNEHPKDFDEALGKKIFWLDDGLYKGYSVAWDPLTGYGEYMKSKYHPSVWMEEEAYNKNKVVLKEGAPKDSHNRADYDLVPMTDEEANWLDNYTLDRSGLYYRYIPKNPNNPALFKKGGAFNVIPEGALHKNRHRLEDLDDKFKEVTTKGIPVVSEEGGKLILHAEVEKEEIILRYDVTKQIEKLMKDGSDEAAIEAGKLLVLEILYNTIDNTKRLI